MNEWIYSKNLFVKFVCVRVYLSWFHNSVHLYNNHSWKQNIHIILKPWSNKICFAVFKCLLYEKKKKFFNNFLNKHRLSFCIFMMPGSFFLFLSVVMCVCECVCVCDTLYSIVIHASNKWFIISFLENF